MDVMLQLSQQDYLCKNGTRVCRPNSVWWTSQRWLYMAETRPLNNTALACQGSASTRTGSAGNQTSFRSDKHECTSELCSSVLHVFSTNHMRSTNHMHITARYMSPAMTGYTRLLPDSMGSSTPSLYAMLSVLICRLVR